MIKDIMRENETVTPNSKELQVLKEHFPGCFTAEGSFDLEKFKGILSDQVAVTNEGYELRFLGKNYARLIASTDTTTVIVPDEEHNAKPENVNSKNAYISGDNLDGLKHLLKSYEGKVKCIYIDPPYNTGTDDFAYNDKFAFTAEDLSRKLNVDMEQANRVLSFTKKGSSSHSAWLTFLYPRIILARDLLHKEGAIFISIDDNEFQNLRLLCNDIFGEENYVASLVWEKKKKASHLSNAVSNIKEYILVYARDISAFSGLVGAINYEPETYPCVNATNARSTRIIPAGIESKYKEANYIMRAGEIISDTTMTLVLKSDLVIENNRLARDLEIEGNWRYKQDAMTEYARSGNLYITRDLYLRRIVPEPKEKGLKDLLLRLGDSERTGYSYEYNELNLQAGGWGSNEDADEEQRLLFGEQSLMSYPKPVLLIMKLISSMRKEDMVICDFFSGSATTAEAVMRLAAKNKSVQFILIQLPEDIDALVEKSTGEEKERRIRLCNFLNSVNRPHTLDQLGIERIIRAANKIREEHPDTTADLGFKLFSLKEPEAETLDKLERFNPRQSTGIVATNTLLEEFGVPTILATWLNHDGYGLSDAATEIDFAGYTGYHMDKHLYLIRPELTDEAITAIVEKMETDGNFNPETVVLFGYSFTWTELDALKNNLSRIRDTEKSHRVNIDIRY